MEPVDLTSGVLDGVVRHLDEESEITCLIHRPLGKRAVAKVVSDEYVVWDKPGQPGDRPGESLPCALRGPRQNALDIEHLVGQIPLDREVGGRDGRSESQKLV